MTLSRRSAADLAALDVPPLVVAMASEGRPGRSRSRRSTWRSEARSRGRSSSRFRGGRDETLHLGGGSERPARVLLVGMGKRDERALASTRRRVAARQAWKLGVGELAFYRGQR